MKFLGRVMWYDYVKIYVYYLIKLLLQKSELYQ